MIIDDHDPIRKALRRILSAMGFGQVIECGDGAEAIKQLAKSPVDLIISDIFMRKVDGFNILKKVRGQDLGSDTPVIIVSGEATKEDIIKAVDLGADDYILKPFQIIDIEKKVTSVLTKYFSPPPLLKLLREGDKLALDGHLYDALKQYEAAERLDPKSSRAKFAKALMFHKLGQTNDAINILTSSSEENPVYNKNFAALADIFLQRNEPNAAIDALKKELDLNPHQTDRQLLLANLLLQHGHFEDAANHFKEALLENPKDKDALIGSGKAYQKLENNDKALYYFKRARRQHPGLTKALRLIVDVYERDKNLKGAVFELLDEINRYPSRFDARIVLSEVYLSMNNAEGAFRVIDEGIAKDPKALPLYRIKAKLLAESGKAEDAFNAMKQVIDLDQSEESVLAFADLSLSIGRPLQAFEVLEKALERTKDRQRVLTRLAESLKRLGYFFQATHCLELALHEKGTIPEKVLRDNIQSMASVLSHRRSGFSLKKSG